MSDLRDRLQQAIGDAYTIERELGFVFPHNPTMAGYWISTENPLFGDRTPLAVMLADGLIGIERIARHLSNAEDW